MKRKIRWGIISTAKIAETDLIPAIKKSKNSELVAVASRNKVKAAKFAKKNKIKKFYDSYKKICEDKDIDIIYNPLPNHLHVNSQAQYQTDEKEVFWTAISLKIKLVIINFVNKAELVQLYFYQDRCTMSICD